MVCSTCDIEQRYLTKNKCHRCYYIVNKDRILKNKKKYYGINKNKINQKTKKYYLDNRMITLSQKKKYYESNQLEICSKKRNYYKDNRNTIIRHNLDYIAKRSSVDPVYRLSRNLRSRLYLAIKNNYKSGSAVGDLGCSISHLKKHLEAQFQPGMTWDNYGRSGWHIDHIRSLSSFDLTDIKQLKKACNYKNLQPLWAKDNLKKGSRS